LRPQILETELLGLRLPNNMVMFLVFLSPQPQALRERLGR
jgi:hypothetical protein